MNINNIGISTIIFDNDDKRRKKAIAHLEAFARVLWGHYYNKGVSSGGAFSDDELEVNYKWRKLTNPKD